MQTNSEQSTTGFIRVTEKVDRTGKGVDNLLAQMRVLFEENKHIQKVVLEAGKPFIHVEKLVQVGEEVVEKAFTYHDAVRSKSMEEYLIEDGKSPYESLFEIFKILTDEQLEVCQVLAGDSARLAKWVKAPRRTTRVYGVPVTQVADLPNEVVVFCGGTTREAGPDDVQFSVKVAIP